MRMGVGYRMTIRRRGGQGDRGGQGELDGGRLIGTRHRNARGGDDAPRNVVPDKNATNSIQCASGASSAGSILKVGPQRVQYLCVVTDANKYATAMKRYLTSRPVPLTPRGSVPS